MSNYTIKEVHEIILGYVLEQGESLWEEFEGDFDGKQEHYLDFLVSKNYINSEQKSDWLKNREFADEFEYEHIEAMTYMSHDEFPYDLMEDNDVIKSNFKLDIEKAKDLKLINVPIFIEAEDVNEFNDIYWKKVLLIIAEYLQENLDLYGEKLSEIADVVNYYRGN